MGSPGRPGRGTATSLDLVKTLRQATPDSLDYLVTDLFENITLYDNTVEAVTVQAPGQGQHDVDVDFTVTKFRADGKGTKTFTNESGNSLTPGELSSLPLRDYVDVAFYRGDELLTRKRVLVFDIENKLTLTLPQAPDRVVLDPDGLLLDGEVGDNVWEGG